MKRSVSLLVLCASVGMIFIAALNARASGTGDSQSNAVHGSNAANQDKPTGNNTDSANYVGAETCKACHEDIYNSWEKTPHWKTTLDTKGGPSHQGCEGCHGPGAAHVAGGGDTTKIFIFKNHSTQEINDRCMTCHAGGTEHMNAINSVHAKNDVSCISCHSPHHAHDTGISAGQGPAGALLHLPSAAKAAIQHAVPSSRERGPGPVHRLPQSTWHRCSKAGADFGGAGRRLLHVPRRQARPVRVRA